MRAYNNYLDKEELATVITTTATSAERRKRLKLKRIVVSEKNYFALKKLGHAGDSFNDVISKLLRIQRNYEEIKNRQQLEHQESEDNNSSSNRLTFPESLSISFDEHDRQQLADLLGLRRGNNSSSSGNDQVTKKASM